MRNSSLVEWSCAENLTGLNDTPKLGMQCILHGRRAFCMGRSRSESGGGLYRRENAGMSSEIYVRIIKAERLRI